MNNAANLSYLATRTLSQFSTKRARKNSTAIEKAGGSRYNTTVIRELINAGCIRSRGAGWSIRVA